MKQEQTANIDGNNNKLEQVINNILDKPINIDCFSLEKTINIMSEFIEQNPIMEDEQSIHFFNTKRKNIELKNKINNLPENSFDAIKQYMPDFLEWRIAIFLSENEECAKKYNRIVDTIKPIIANESSFADALRKLFNGLNAYIERRAEAMSDNCREKMVLMIYFMYYYCDIGKEPDADSSTN